MITDTFDDSTEEIIKVFRNENAVRVDACILTFSRAVMEYVLDDFECEKIGDLFSSNGANPVYGFTYKEKHFAIYVSYVGAPGCVADIEDTMSLINTNNYIVFGGSGCLNKEIARGRIMVPTAAYRDEGTSYHYAPASDYIIVKNSCIVAQFMEAAGLPYVREKHGQQTPFTEKQGEILRSVKLRVVFRLKWSVQRFRQCVTSETWMHIFSLHQEICLTRQNGTKE